MQPNDSKLYTLIDPTTYANIPDFKGAHRLASLAGTTLGIIDDSKRNADVLLEELANVLINRYEISEVVWHKKPSASRPADPNEIDKLAEKCDSAIIAIGD
tara:strand:- start:362 stop:664 length:303 start_codon:yes stop_codon:yes gene_type:complete